MLAFIAAAALSVADFVTEHIVPKKFLHNQKLISFSAGVSIAYILLQLFPELAALTLLEGRSLLMYALFGFILFHLLERYLVVSHHIGKFAHAKVHLGCFFIYNFLIGIVLWQISQHGRTPTLLFLIPFSLYLIVEILPQKFQIRSILGRIFYSCAPLLGVLLASSFPAISSFVYEEVFALITGTLLYIVVRQSLPKGRESSPLFFLLGSGSYALMLLSLPGAW